MALRAPNTRQPVTTTFVGMDNVNDPAVVDGAILMVNVDPGDLPSLRPGRETVLAGEFHSGWSNPYSPKEGYFVGGAILHRLNLDGTVDALRFDLIPGLPVAFCQVNDAVAYSNGLQFGVIENRVDTPPFIPDDPYKERMVAGKMMEWFNGRLYAMVDNPAGAKGCALICSDALDVPGGIESMDVRQNIVAVFDGEAAMIQRVDDGLFVGTTLETFFLGISDTVLEGGLQSQVSVAPYGVVQGTNRPIKAQLLGIRGLTGNAALWYSERGVCAGGASGFFTNLTESKVSIPVGQRGTAVVWEKGGQIFYKAAMQGDGEAYNPFTSGNLVEEVTEDYA